jgi:hypothetical protein
MAYVQVSDGDENVCTSRTCCSRRCLSLSGTIVSLGLLVFSSILLIRACIDFVHAKNTDSSSSSSSSLNLTEIMTPVTSLPTLLDNDCIIDSFSNDAQTCMMIIRLADGPWNLYGELYPTPKTPPTGPICGIRAPAYELGYWGKEAVLYFI